MAEIRVCKTLCIFRAGRRPWPGQAPALHHSRGAAVPRNRVWVTMAAVLWALLLAASASFAASPSVSVAQYVRAFELSYRNVRTLESDFSQTSFAWGRRRVESGTVYLARGGKMRWVYHQPEEKIFLSNGKQLFLYIPAEKQLTISSLRDIQDARVPLDILLSHLQLSRIFSRVEFADQALEREHGDRVLRGYPRTKYQADYRSVLMELSPQFDVRRLVVFYPDNSTMQFAFSHIERNKFFNPALFLFTPPPGTEIIRQ